MRATADRVWACLPGETIRSLEDLGEGDFCRAWLLNGRLVVRIPMHPEAARVLEVEACLLPRIASGLPLPVPSPRCVPCPDGDVPLVSVHPYLPGVPLTRERWKALEEPVRTDLARRVGGFLSALHSLDVGPARACGLEALDHPAESTGVLARLLGTGSPVPPVLRRALVGVFRRFGAAEARGSWTPAILHMDLSPGHVLANLEAGRILGILDWGDAAIGDPARDFIFLFEDWDRDFLEAAVDAYGLEAEEPLLSRVLFRYLVDQLDWTLRAKEEGRERDLRYGLAAVAAAVREIDTGTAEG